MSEVAMQSDMHYDCNYVLARLAGLPENISRMIANSGQFVDDNNCKESEYDFIPDNVLILNDRGRIRRVATAHHPKELENLNFEDQVHVWVPFHFYPGGDGDNIRQRLICTTDSENINKAINHHLDLYEQSFSPYLMGIIAHVYGDTFSHYGFSGIGDEINKTQEDGIKIMNEPYIDKHWEGEGKGLEYIWGKFDKFMERNAEKEKKIIKEEEEHIFKNLIGKIKDEITSKMKSEASAAALRKVTELTDAASLGHAFAATFPDRPYMHWTIKWENEGLRKTTPSLMLTDRNNPKTFLEATEKIYDMFRKYRNYLEAERAENNFANWGKGAPTETTRTH